MTNEKKAPGVWGIMGPQFIHRLKDKQVTVAVSTGNGWRATDGGDCQCRHNLATGLDLGGGAST